MRVLFKDDDGKLHVVAVADVWIEDAEREGLVDIYFGDSFDEGGFYYLENITQSDADAMVMQLFNDEKLDLTDRDVMYEENEDEEEDEPSTEEGGDNVEQG